MFQIPVGRVREPLHMTVQKEELRTGTVDVGVSIAFAGDCGKTAIIEEPHER